MRIRNLIDKESDFMKKKLISALALPILVLGTLTGCGSKKTIAPFVMPENGYDGSEVTITFYHAWGQNNQEFIRDYIVKPFNKLFPNIHIDDQYIGDYDAVRDKIVNDITVKNLPSLSFCYPDHIALYNRSNVVITLDQFMNDTKEYQATDAEGNTFTYTFGMTSEQKSDIIDAYYEEGKIFGYNLMYSLPFAKSTEVLYYNKDFFDKNNLTVPTTWDEMWDVCAEIKKIDPDCFPLGYDSSSNWFITMCEQLGSGYTTNDPNNYFVFNNKENKDWLTALKGKYTDGLFTTKGLTGTYTSSLFTSAADVDNKGCCYLCIGSSGGSTYQLPEKDSEGKYPFNIGVVRTPVVEGKNHKAIQQGPNICLFNNGNAQEICASWLFLKYIETNPEMQANLSLKTGYSPSLKSVYDLKAYKNWMDEGSTIQALAAKVCSEQNDSYFVSPAFVGSSKARDEVGSLLDAVLTGKDIDASFNTALEECEYMAE